MRGQLLYLVSNQTIANSGRRLAVQHVARVGHGEVLQAGGVGQHPGHHVDDLPAMEIDDAEGGALLDLESVAVPAGDNVRLCFRVIHYRF